MVTYWISPSYRAKRWLSIEYHFHIDICRCSFAVVTSLRCGCDWRKLTFSFARSKFSLTEKKITSYALVTSPLILSMMKMLMCLFVNADFSCWHIRFCGNLSSVSVINFCKRIKGYSSEKQNYRRQRNLLVWRPFWRTIYIYIYIYIYSMWYIHVIIVCVPRIHSWCWRSIE